MGNIFSSHFEVIRERLDYEGRIANSFQHNTNRGNIREAFARELLDNCTSQFCSVGSGEIIHRKMDVDDKRNQTDVVLYNNRYPKLYGAGGVDLFFVETVSSFIEVKSKLSKPDIRQAAEASKRIKTYPYAPAQRFNPTGMVKNPRPYSFLFAYDTYASSIEKVTDWMKEVASEDEYNLTTLKETKPDDRIFFPNLFLDGVFVLNRGYVNVDALPTQSPSVSRSEVPIDHIWAFGESGELERLWAIVNIASEKLHWNEVDIAQYIPGRWMSVSD